MTRLPVRWLVLAVAVSAVALAATAWWAGRSPAPAEPQRSTSAPGGYVPPVAPQGAPSGSVAAARSDIPVVDPAWTADIAESAGIPRVAVNAYAVAELRMRGEAPECGIGWSTLAGIGYVESRHGTIDDSVLGLDGVSRPPIIGPPLDGTGGFAAIEAHEATREIHGDPRWDRAVGPMQFIGSTWDRWRSDGDGDGVLDPLDIDDAAYAAARYLCHDGHDLSSGDGWSAAVFSYNHDRDYVAQVYAAATSYAERTS